MIRSSILTIVCGVMLSGCVREESVVVISSHLTDRKEVNTAVPEEYSSYAPASAGATVWVVGKVRNEGAEEVKNVEIIFRCTEGVDTRVLVATVKSIPPGGTVSYRTKGFRSQYQVKLLDEPPEIDY